MKKIIFVIILMVNMLLPNARAAEGFVINKIEIAGLQRISASTVYSYLPVKTGQVLHSGQSAEIIKSLYKTGFFEHITLERHGNVLVIHVTERPTIGQLKMAGNSIIPTDKLTTVMKSVNIAEGRTFDRLMLDRIKQSLLNQYYQLGRYNAKVDVTVTPMERNRVLIKIDISEGLVAKVHHINIIGNHAFSERKLVSQLEISKPGLFTFFTQTDRYSQEKLDTSLENLRNFYLDHGYLKFENKSSQVEITPDRKTIFLTFVIEEGAQYKVSQVTVAGNLIVPRADLLRLIKVKTGQYFSRTDVIASEKAINEALGDKGYVFAEIGINPVMDDAHQTVALTFTVNPGKRVYVRHVYFTDNAKTNDATLRREIEQMESAVFSTSKLEQSKRRLSILPYVKDVQMSVVPVPGSTDQADVNYKVTEENTAQANFSVGYSQRDHVILGAGLNQKNFLGTGETLGFNVSRSRVEQYYGINFTDPYYTPEGISRSINLSASRFNPNAVNDFTKGYKTNQYDGSVVYGIPLGQEKGVFNRVQLGYGYENILLRLYQGQNNNGISNQVNDFVNNYGRHYQQLDLIAGFSRDSRNKSIFPTQGMIHTLGATVYAPVTKNGLKYYTLSYNTKWYQPLAGSFIVTARGDAGFGGSFSHHSENFPFFKYFYAGGMDSVRGYQPGTLGPKDSLGNPSGGNLLVSASLGLIFPNPMPDSVRTSFFVDGGNVYDTFDNRRLGGTGSGSVRYSTGVEVDWLTPLGVIDLSLAKPLNMRQGDLQEIFQFALGANFG